MPLLRSLLAEITDLCVTLLRLLIPVIIVVRVLQVLGIVDWIARLLSPLMDLFGLPASMALVLATTLFTGIYPGIVVFFTLAPYETLTVAQVTVLGCVMLIAHGLPLEVRVAQQAGVSWLFTALVRLVGGVVFGLLVHHFLQYTGWLQQISHTLVRVQSQGDSTRDWLLLQVHSLLVIVAVVAMLVCLLRLLRWLGVERLMILLLRRPLALLGIGPQATSLTIVGITLGLTFGAGILIREARAGTIPARDVWAAMTLLGVCHSIIEDTITILLLGAHIGAVLWARLLFAFVYSALLFALLRSRSEWFYNRHMAHSVDPRSTR